MNPDEKKCPFCAEIIKAEAVKCKHCGTSLGSSQAGQGWGEIADEQPATGRNLRSGTTGVGAFILIVALPILFFTNPDERDFRKFVSEKISSIGTIEQVPLGNKLISTLASLAVEKVTRRDNYLLFSTFEIDTTMLEFFNVDMPPLKFVGVLGTIIPLKDYSGLLDGATGRQASTAEDEGGEPAEATVGQIYNEREISGAIEDGLIAAVKLKAGVAEFHAQTGSFPETCHEIGEECPSHISVESGGSIVFDLDSTDVTALAGTTIRLSPRANSNGDVVWECSSNAPRRYLPSACLPVGDAAPEPDPSDVVDSSVVVLSEINVNGFEVAKCDSQDVIAGIERFFGEAIQTKPGRTNEGKWWDLSSVSTTGGSVGRFQCAARLEMGAADQVVKSMAFTYTTIYEDARLTVRVSPMEDWVDHESHGAETERAERVPSNSLQPAELSASQPADQAAASSAATMSSGRDDLASHRITLPTRKFSPPPEYPAASRRAGEAGTVQIEVLVLEDGSPGEIKVVRSSGFNKLDDEAVRVVKNEWQFEPGTEDGEPKAMPVSFGLTFRVTD